MRRWYVYKRHDLDKKLWLYIGCFDGNPAAIEGKLPYAHGEIYYGQTVRFA